MVLPNLCDSRFKVDCVITLTNQVTSVLMISAGIKVTRMVLSLTVADEVMVIWFAAREMQEYN